MNLTYHLSTVFVILSMLAAPLVPDRDGLIASPQQILEDMTTEEKVGQLFLVSASIDQLNPDGYLYDLVRNYHIGGVVLEPPSSGEQDISSQELQEMINDLQAFQYEMSGEETIYVEADDRMVAPEYVPLYISTRLNGDQLPYTRIMSEASYIPSQMALGASWDSENAYSAGSFIGAQLSTLGINLIFGPGLDVLDDPSTSSQNGIGVRSFGGDPYWVGEMGERFIAGVHEGSQNRVSVIAAHFPGLGSSDRPMEEEVATIRKSLEQLKQIELAPFFSVTEGVPGEPSVADGLLTGHIRYQGFQGNIRATTKPVSLDSTALSQILELEPFNDWRSAGGLIVSDSLGCDSIKRFMESTGTVYTGFLTARNAFLAGNDMMILSDINTDDEKTEYDAVSEVLISFSQKYREDDVFAQQVDYSVLRILQSKTYLYNGVFSPAAVLRPESLVEDFDTASEIGVNTARGSLTLISPSDVIELDERTGGAPQYGERVVVFSDTRPSAACVGCITQDSLQVRAFEEAVNRLYGPSGAGLVSGWQFESFSMEDLAAFLGIAMNGNVTRQVAPTEDVDSAVREADWILFFVQDSSDEYYGSNALTEFLDLRSDLVRESLVVVFAMGAPFGLDATDFSKVDVFYGLYSSSAPFIEAAARVLFSEMTPAGALPVSVAGVGYDLIVATSPDPYQVIPLEGRVDEQILSEISAAEIPIGGVIELLAGPIVDVNGNVVPDKTPVEFIVTYQGESTNQILIPATTSGGSANVSTTVERPGVLSARVESSGALVSETVAVNIPVPEELMETPDTSVPAMEQVEIPTPVIVPTTGPDNGDNSDQENALGIAGFSMGLLGLAFISGALLLTAVVLQFSNRERVRYLLMVVGGGLLFYDYLALGLPGSRVLLERLGEAGGLVAAAAGGAVVYAVLLIRVLGRRSDKGEEQGDKQEETDRTQEESV